ncbi:MAG: glucose-1-phosphate cytidylyltransferase [Candidatus Dormibacteria bacterium]
MKVVLLAGGRGTRLSEETLVRPKPMVEIGGKPILWHIMKVFSSFGYDDFIVCCGYKGFMIKEFFANYALHNSNVTVDLRGGGVTFHDGPCEPWRVTLVDTGELTMTAGRLKRVAAFLDAEVFCMTYGDGVADIDLRKLVAFHHARGLLATVTAVRPPGRFGHLALSQELVTTFDEKPHGDGQWINAGFFVLSPKVVDYILGDSSIWEDAPLRDLASQGQLAAYRHEGFWMPMDTQRDRIKLEELWASGSAPWKFW